MIEVTKTFLPPIEEYNAYLQQIWGSNKITNRGNLVKNLEAQLIDSLGVKNLLCVGSGTLALQIAIKALELKGEIITTPFSYVATVSSIVWENCTPVLVDINPAFLTIDETKIEAAITEKTEAILATHIFGHPCNVEEIEKIAQKHHLKVIYDAAHCFGVKYKNESILNWGDISILSFNATKIFHTGEGGAIICQDANLAHKVFYSHNFGHHGTEDFFGLGVNGKMSELHAAMGLAVFPYIQEIIEHRKKCSQMYDELLAKTSLRKPAQREGFESNYLYYPIIFSTQNQLLATRDELNRNGFYPRRYFYPSLTNLPYLKKQNCPISDETSENILCLPLSSFLMVEEIQKITAIIAD